MTPMFEEHSISTPSKQPSSGAIDSPSWNTTESPSARLLREIGLQTLEYHRDLHNRLDQRALETERAHIEALAAASAEHDRVRRAAERAQQWVELELVKERQKQEEDESQELLRERHETVEREIARKRREIDEVRQLEERRGIAEEATRQAAAAEARRRFDEEKSRREAVEQAEQQKRIEAVKAREEQATVPPPTAPEVVTKPQAPIVQEPQKQQSLVQPPTASGLITTMAERKASHEQYVKLHQRLKEMRRFIANQIKQDVRVKSRVGDMRREIKKSVGQLTGEKGANRNQMQKIRQILIEASSMTQVMVDVRQFLVSPPTVASDGSDCQIPGVFIYLLNILSKNIINQFIDEAGVMPKQADPIGVVAVSMFAQAEFRWKGLPLIDILLAKFHVVCPILWGVYGDETTEGGRTALGWWREAPGGPWVTEQRHSERMTGLGAGFAALALRDFSKSKQVNPFPPSNYWHAMACIVNTPPAQVTQTHFIVLKAMIENYIPRFIGYYGQAAKAALRKAIVEFPQQSPKSIGASGLATLTATLKRDFFLSL